MPPEPVPSRSSTVHISKPEPITLRTIWRLMRYRGWPYVHEVTIRDGRDEIAFAAGQDGIRAGDRVVVRWDRA